MANERYAETQARIEALDKKWKPLFDMPGINVEHRFLETLAENDDPKIVAQTISEYWYRDALIYWYMPVAARLSDDDLERTYVHENCHVLVAAMEAHLPEKYKGEHNELAVENITRALIATHRLSRGMK